METEYKELSFGVTGSFEDGFSVETWVDAEERGGAKRTLSVEAEAKAIGVELLDGEAKINGKVNYRILYLDDSDNICGLDCFKDFEFTLMGADIRADQKASLVLSVVEAFGEADGKGIKLNAEVGASLKTFGARAERAVARVTGAEQKEEQETCGRLYLKRTFEMELEKEEPVGANVKRILLFDASAAVKEAMVKGGAARISGEAIATAVYITEEGACETRTMRFPFLKEEELGGDRASVTVCVKNARVILSGDESESTMGTEITLGFTVCEYTDETLSFITDVYSENELTEESFRTVSMKLFSAQRFYGVFLSGTIEAEGALKALAVRPGGVAVANVTASEGSVKAEGVISFTAVFETADGVASEKKELPFVFDLPFDGAKDISRAEALVEVVSAEPTVIGGGISVKAEMNISVSLFDEKEVSFVESVNAGEKRAEESAGMTVYFGESGEDLWKIAKAVRCAPSTLLKNYPELTNPLQEDKRIIVFRSK